MCECLFGGNGHLPKSIWLTLSLNEKELGGGNQGGSGPNSLGHGDQDGGGLSRAVWSLARVLLAHVPASARVPEKGGFGLRHRSGLGGSCEPEKVLPAKTGQKPLEGLCGHGPQFSRSGGLGRRSLGLA